LPEAASSRLHRNDVVPNGGDLVDIVMDAEAVRAD
jgi:hypothetical protein